MDDLDGGVVEIRYTYNGLKEGKTVISCRNVHSLTGEVSDNKNYDVVVDKNLNIDIKLQHDTEK